MEPEIWQVLPRETSDSRQPVSNCSVPKYLLQQHGKTSLPLFFKITNLETNQYAITVADQFLETEGEQHIIHLPSTLIQYLHLGEVAQVDLINQSPDLLPPIAKSVTLQPLDPLFDKLKNPKKALEKSLQDSYILGIGYQIPINVRTMSKSHQIHNKTIPIQVVALTDLHDHPVKFANINHTDLLVEFSGGTQPHKEGEAPLPPEQPPLYSPDKPWIPFCGGGRVLSTGAYVKGTSQNP